MDRWTLWLKLLAVLVLACPSPAQEEEEELEQQVQAQEQPAEEPEPESGNPLDAAIHSLRFRALGPALMSGRVGDFAVQPDNHSVYYVAVASGGVWKTENAGVTYEPIFDGQGSYSIGCVTIDPTDYSTVWVGTGENNSQRSVSFGDGVYRSDDGGSSWKNMGLKGSEHIGMIAIDPRDGDRVFVAAQGPLWSPGGDRGLYRTTDGGQNWERVLYVSENTGANDVYFDPRDSDVMYATTYQRRRHVWTLVDGGPESGIWKSTDGGTTWRKLENGIPGGDKGRIGLAVSPVDPDVIYAIIEAADDKGGVFRSDDGGESWHKQSSFMTTSPQYYNELVPSPTRVDRVYALDTWLKVSDDGGKTWENVPGQNKHVDNHALWIDPEDEEHLLVGCDGGIYETWDRSNWQFKPNLPVTQFYRVAVDNAEPFYNVYGGTQDNSTLGGPSRTFDEVGITNADWSIIVGGDGFQPAVDPEDPDTVYGEWQYGGLTRFDRRTGQGVSIRPRTAPGDPPLVFNWDSPLMISPHSHTRLYFGGRRLWKSDNRGDDWTAISGNLTRGLDRNQLEVMGEVQKPNAVAKHQSTSIYGNIVSISESPRVEGLIYVGTDDGLVQITEDGGQSWRRVEVELLDTVPKLTYVSCVRASATSDDRVYLTLDNHKNGDFKPYVFRSDDRGRTWTPIKGDLPERNYAHSIAEDEENPDLLFCGTEFGCYCTIDGGKHWVELQGTPPIAVRDLAIQRRETDLVIGTFGRGVFVLDDYSMLRELSSEALEAEAKVFKVRDPVLYLKRSRYGGGGGKGWQGATFYAADNPEYGATFRYYLKEKFETLKEKRLEQEKKEGWEYPKVEQFEAERLEREPRVLLVVRDEEGSVVRRLVGARSEGVHRTTWDFRYPSPRPIDIGAGAKPAWNDRGGGALVAPGHYTVEMVLDQGGKLTPLADAVGFDLQPMNFDELSEPDRARLRAFQQEVGRLEGALLQTLEVAGEAQDRIASMRLAIHEAPAADQSWLEREENMRRKLDGLLIRLRGDAMLTELGEPEPMSVQDRVSSIVDRLWDSNRVPTESDREQYKYAADEFGEVLLGIRSVVESEIPSLEQDLEGAGAPWTPGRLPEWEP